MKKIYIRRLYRMAFGVCISIALIVATLFSRALSVHAYIFATTCATRMGTVSIVPVKGAKTANGYYNLGGYQVTYTIQKDSWVAYYELLTGGFYIGNNLNTTGGCQFGYQNGSGVVYEAGAVQLGSITDGKLVAEADVINNQVTCTFTVSSLSELPTYIAYAYEPAPSAYLHLTNEYGDKYHVWHYQSLAGASVSNVSQIDADAPTLQLSTEPVGDAVITNGKTWAKEMNVVAIAKDVKSGAQGIYVYQNGKKVGQYQNTVQSATYQTTHTVTENGTYEVMAYDRLNNRSGKIAIAIEGIDTTAPIIEKMEKDEAEFCLLNKITSVSNDGQSGLAELAYSWNGGEWTDSAEYDATENGVYELRVRDALGNEAASSIEVTNIDNIPPVIRNIKENKTADGKVKVEVDAVDNAGGCGLHESAYSFDGGKTWQTQSYRYVEKNGVYRICVRDVLESKADTEFEVKTVTNTEETDEPITPDIPQKPKEPESPDTPNTPNNPSVDDITDEPEEVVVNDEPVDGDADTYNVLHLPRLERKSTTVQVEEKLTEPEAKAPGTIINMQPIRQNPVQKVALAVLISAFVMGVLGLGLYLWLFYLQRSCVLYGVDDKQDKIRICRLPVRRYDTEWQVKVPDDRLGDHGTGKYVLVFHPSFVKEEMPASVIILIAERTIREILDQEVTFCI